ncbi:MAG: cytochrome c-type biogenesis protein [Xanthobacteraceae bacterium]
MRSVMRWFLLALLLVAGVPAMAVQPDEILQDPTLEARARALSRELRCMVCQNQSIDDSDAPLARELRILVRDQIKTGASDQQVLDFLVARYGEFVLLRPRFAPHTALLWLVTPFALISGAIVLIAVGRRRTRTSADAPQLTPVETARLARLLERGNE